MATAEQQRAYYHRQKERGRCVRCSLRAARGVLCERHARLKDEVKWRKRTTNRRRMTVEQITFMWAAYYVGEWSTTQIAEHLGVNRINVQRAVKAKRHRAVCEVLREMLERGQLAHVWRYDFSAWSNQPDHSAMTANKKRDH